jgi:hypothetical protein
MHWGQVQIKNMSGIVEKKELKKLAMIVGSFTNSLFRCIEAIFLDISPFVR